MIITLSAGSSRVEQHEEKELGGTLKASIDTTLEEQAAAGELDFENFHGSPHLMLSLYNILPKCLVLKPLLYFP